jgi:DNA-binding transcriptional ArsR family regulator
MARKSSVAARAGGSSGGADAVPQPQPQNGGPDYDAPAELVVREPEQLKALADELRSQVIQLLRDRAYSTQQLARTLGLPKSTVAHHLKVLEHAGLIRVVRTRKVRAVTERFYGRTARLFLFHVEDPAEERALGATVLRQAAREVEQASAAAQFGHVKARLTAEDAARLERRLRRLLDDLNAADTPGGAPFALVAALYDRTPDA